MTSLTFSRVKGCRNTRLSRNRRFRVQLNEASSVVGSLIRTFSISCSSACCGLFRSHAVPEILYPTAYTECMSQGTS